MSANLYTIQDLLIGKTYRSQTLEGEIVNAEKRNDCVWYGENVDAYLVQVKGVGAKNLYRTVAIKVGE